jgi:hypothetical protein
MTILGALLIAVGFAANLPDMWTVGVVLGLVGLTIALLSRASGLTRTGMRGHYF